MFCGLVLVGTTAAHWSISFFVFFSWYSSAPELLEPVQQPRTALYFYISQCLRWCDGLYEYSSYF